ncbi:peroxisomal targeting signal 2 receptor-like [Tachypleus tridentatus]|uniref:peroxisomal targeting signal 2 receptor-like n=1 Tax=Tachypleus tridentatus TaxID=6853 RepID=UPI003FD51020
MPTTFRTTGQHGYGIKFSPFFPNRLACATSQNYGIAGKGSLYILEETPSGLLQSVSISSWNDGLYDVTWSELNSNIIVTGSGDGSVQIWDTVDHEHPVAVLKDHNKEVYSVDWSQTRDEQLLLTASWDKTVKLWDPQTTVLLNTFIGHTSVVYCCVWAPALKRTFASVSGDGTLRVWSTQNPAQPNVTIPAHDSEILSCDWCKYDENIMVTGATDGQIRGWDLRLTRQPLFQLTGHTYAVRRVKFSPHVESLLASVSYDFSTRLWNWKVSPSALHIMENHTEFVYGLDFNAHVNNQLVDCGWDELIQMYRLPLPPNT